MRFTALVLFLGLDLSAVGGAHERPIPGGSLDAIAPDGTRRGG